MRYFFALLLLLSALPLHAGNVQVLALFQDAALLSIDGRQQLLRAGQRDSSGLQLIAADPRRAVVEIDGKRHQLTLQQAVVGGYRDAEEPEEVSIPRNMAREYQTSVSINGRSIIAVIDTGANAVALSERHASYLGLNYSTGEPVTVTTASGVTRGYRLNLSSVDVGGIVARQVPAVVIEGDFPHIVLLGMTFLEHVEMRERDNILYLRSRY